MIGASYIGAQPVGAFRRILTAAIVFTVTVAGGGGAVAGLVKVAAISAAPDGGGSVAAGLVKVAAISAAPNGGGSAFANLTRSTINLFAADIPAGRVIAAPATPGVTAAPIATFTATAVKGFR